MGRWRVFLGFVSGIVYLFLSHAASWPRVGAGLATAFLGLALRGWAAGYLEKGKRLAQDGPYAFWRHPLYVGSFLMALGFVVAGTGSDLVLHGLAVWTAFILLFFGVYPPRILEEEKSLEKYFGDAWRAYADKTPRFLPRLRRQPRENPDVFRWLRYRKNREFNAALGYLTGVGVILVKAWLRL